MPARALALVDEHPALSWARSGAMALTGFANGPAQMCVAPLATCADAALAVCASLALKPLPDDLRGALLLSERAAIAELQRAGRSSPGGACRLLALADGWIALNLARASDWDLLPAWLECDEIAADWDVLAQLLVSRRVEQLVERGRELGLALAAVDTAHSTTARAFQITVQGEHIIERRRERPRVIDLSSLWAGPLCSHLLQLGGAEVIKVESVQRPDGARLGPPAFFDLLNAGKHSVLLDLQQADGRSSLLDLVRSADIVIEGSRPRALRQLGVDAESLVRTQPGLTWISLNGYGRGGDRENWIAYGDDAAVAAGLTSVTAQSSGEHFFVGDAIADPLTGLHAAAAAWAGWRSGGGQLVSVALSEVVRQCISFEAADATTGVRERHLEWMRVLQSSAIAIAMPQSRALRGHAVTAGADSASVLESLREGSGAC